MIYHFVAPTSFIVLIKYRLAYIAKRMVLLSSSNDIMSNTPRNTNGWQVLAGFCGGFAVSVLAVLFL